MKTRRTAQYTGKDCLGSALKKKDFYEVLATMCGCVFTLNTKDCEILISL